LVAWAGVVVIHGGNPLGTQAASRSVVQRAASAAPTRPRPHRSALAAPAGESIVAQVRAPRINVYPSVGATAPKMALSNPTAIGGPLVFLVTSVGTHRLKVLLPTRPNLSEGWVSRSDVQLAFDPYRIEVQLREHRMTVWHGKSVAERDPVGVGRRAVTPTPFGLYYITELLKQPDPTGVYGPYAFGLSAHSDVLHEFEGGNGEIGLHGTNEPWAVGTDVSHGCIRVYNSVITRLAHELPLGTPVRIAP
jgi:lipoprotein-anchoring transpeptidase ErfK/SrfK